MDDKKVGFTKATIFPLDASKPTMSQEEINEALHEWVNKVHETLSTMFVIPPDLLLKSTSNLAPDAAMSKTFLQMGLLLFGVPLSGKPVGLINALEPYMIKESSYSRMMRRKRERRSRQKHR